MRFLRSVALAAAVLATATGIALAVDTPVKFSSTPLARGTWDRAERTDFLSALAGQGGLASSDVFMVKATLGPSTGPGDPPGTTGWHLHTGPSALIVTQGTMAVSHRMANGRCMTREVGAGEAIFHTTGLHNFTNSGSGLVEFYIAYFVPAGPPLIPADDPGC